MFAIRVPATTVDEQQYHNIRLVPEALLLLLLSSDSLTVESSECGLFDKRMKMRANLEKIHGRLETILENLELIPDTQEVVPNIYPGDPQSPLSQLGRHWLQFWSISYPQVRNERNLARDEAKQLRMNLEAAVKESNACKRDKNELEIQIGQLKKEMEKVHLMLIKHAGQFDRSSSEMGQNGGDEADGGGGREEISPDLSSSDGLKRGAMRDSANREDGLVSK